MTHRLLDFRILLTPLLVCLFLPRTGQAQPLGGAGIGVGVGAGCVPGHYGGVHKHGKRGPYGPYLLPPPYWNYPGLAPGPYTTFNYPFYGWPGFRGAHGGFWSNGLSLYGPPVPVYGPIPGVLGNYDLVNQWKHRPTLGWGLGWFGYYSPSPRPRPVTVNIWPVVEPVLSPAPLAAAEPVPEGCVIISVKLPQPAAEVFVDGVKTAQTGTDRIFESPPAEAGKHIQYEMTARWIERGVTLEETRVVSGKPGEVVRVDFTLPEAAATSR
jgi:uncharacterized protein (TIGR03000 family)